MNNLRDYQVHMLDAFTGAINRGQMGIYGVLPTGCGKTRVASELLKQSLPLRSLWVVHTRELVHQAADAIRENVKDAHIRVGAITRAPTVGIVMADDDETDADIVVGSVQTLRSSHRIAGLGRMGGVCVIDECHHVTSDNTYADLVAFVREQWNMPVVGLTATPFRSDSKALNEVLPDCVFERTIADMIRDGWLCDLRYKSVQIDGLDLSEAKMVRRLGEVDFSESSIAPKVEASDVVAEVADKTASEVRHRGVPSLAFCTSVNHAVMLANAYNLRGVSAAAVYGAMPLARRMEVLRRWRDGSIQMVTNCAVLTEGFDYPQIGTLVIARPTMSVTLYTQMVGRGTRVVDGKSDCVILDITGRMPARAVRVNLDDLLGENLSETEEDGEVILGRKRLNAARPRVHALRDPYGRARFAWTEHPFLPRVWFTPIGERVSAVLIPDAGGSGLYMPFISRDDMPELQPAGTEYVTRRQAIADMEATLARARVTSKALSHKDRKWRNEMPTDKQLVALSRWNRRLHAIAKQEQWSRGDVSLAMDACVIASRIRAEMARRERR